MKALAFAALLLLGLTSSASAASHLSIPLAIAESLARVALLQRQACVLRSAQNPQPEPATARTGGSWRVKS